MSTALRLTVNEYDAMVDRGAFSDLEGRRIELLYGELREMSPQGSPHCRVLSYLTRWSIERTLPQEVNVRIQMPISIRELDSEPAPDVAWARPLVDDSRHPHATEVLLLIEVGMATLRTDIGEKSRLYARAGVADYWVVDVANSVLHVFREPSSEGYLQHDRLRHGECRPLAFPDAVLELTALWGK